MTKRLIKSGHLKVLERAGIEIHSRSVFLQGLLLLSAHELPAGLEKLRDHLNRYHKNREALGLSPVEAALAFALQCNEVNHVLCGVNNRLQLEEIVKSSHILPNSTRVEFFSEFSLYDDDLINPSKWALKRF